MFYDEAAHSNCLAVAIVVTSASAQMILPVPQSAYSQAVKIKGGTLVCLSGVGPADENGVLAAPGDFPGQVQATWENMRRVLAKTGGSLEDIVTMTVYTTERRWGDIFTDMRKEVLKPAIRPARLWRRASSRPPAPCWRFRRLLF